MKLSFRPCLYFWASTSLASVIRLPSPPALSISPIRLEARDECGVPPPELQMNRSSQFPDGSYGCTIVPDDPDPMGAQKQCQAVCPSDTASSQEGIGPAIVYLAANWPAGFSCAGQPIISQDVTLGRCICGVPVIEYLVKEIVISLPKITSVGCLAFFGALQTVTEWISKLTRTDVLLDGISALVGGFASISISAPTDLDVIPMIFDWLSQNFCDTSSLPFDIQQQIKDTFGVIINFSDGRGQRTGPRRPKDSDSSASAPESAAPPPTAAQTPSAETPPPTSAAPSQTQADSQTSTTGSSTSTPACGLVKRDRERGKASWSSCDANGVVHMTKITTMKFGGPESTFTTTCSSTWKHACAHYSSVVVNNPAKGWNALKCADSLGLPNVGQKDRPILEIWSRQHHADWLDGRYRIEEDCQRDEWPPVYFFEPGDSVIKNDEQVVRYLPGKDNTGAAVMWRSFCFNRGLDAADNEIQLEDPRNRAPTVTVNKGTTTSSTEISASVNYTPVFSIASYELDDLDPANFGLLENPCVPLGISDDHLFPLLKTDPAVTKSGTLQWTHDYEQPPDQNVLAAAVDIRGSDSEDD